MRAKTIGQYAITKWLYQEFIPGSLKINFTGNNEATIEDCNHETAKVIYDPETREVYME